MHTGTILRVTLALALSSTLAACDNGKASAEKAVRNNLKDPDSARFGEFYYNKQLKRACFTVNAKNSMGGYTGDQQVALRYKDDRWTWISSTEETSEGCRKSWADNKDYPD